MELDRGSFHKLAQKKKIATRPKKNMLSTLFLATLPSFIIFRSAWQTLFREIVFASFQIGVSSELVAS